MEESDDEDGVDWMGAMSALQGLSDDDEEEKDAKDRPVGHAIAIRGTGCLVGDVLECEVS